MCSLINYKKDDLTYLTDLLQKAVTVTNFQKRTRLGGSGAKKKCKNCNRNYKTVYFSNILTVLTS